MSIEPIMQYFEFKHLKSPLAEMSARFHALAWTIHDELPRSPERTVTLRKLLEAKDAAVRSRMFDSEYEAKLKQAEARAHEAEARP